MLLVLGRMTANPAVMDDYAKDLAALIPQVLTEDGCHFYSVVIENKEEGIVAVAEMWDDEAALLKHFTQPWVAAFIAKYGAEILGSTVKVFDAANERDLPSN